MIGDDLKKRHSYLLTLAGPSKKRKECRVGSTMRILKPKYSGMVAGGQAVAYVSKALGVSENLIYRWKQKTAGIEKAVLEVDPTSLLVENQHLKEWVLQLEIERDILEKP